MTKTVLLLDTAFAAVPIHAWLTSQGYDVWTIGNRSHDPLALAEPDRWIMGDYSDINFVKKAIVDHAFSALIPGCTDVSMDTFTKVNPGGPYTFAEAANQSLNNKKLFRQVCADIGLPTPKVFASNALPATGKVIFKPVDGYSGRGVSICNASDLSGAQDALAKARAYSPTKAVICEEFVEGELRSYSAFIAAGKVSKAFSVREGSRFDPYAVDTSYLLEDTEAPEREILKTAVEALVSNLQLCDGLLHLQYICADDRVAIIEATRRCPGDLYSMLIEFSTGFPFAAAYASYFVNARQPIGDAKRRHIVRHTVKQKGREVFTALPLSLLRNIFAVFPVRRLGEPMNPSVNERTALTFMEFANQEEAQGEYFRILNSISATPAA